jgi:hypothetical protein
MQNTTQPANSTHPKGLRIAFFLLFAGVFLRCPPILLHGRMWGEELTVFLAEGWNKPLGTALFAPHFGYYSLWDNSVAALAIHALPLSWMALFFTWCAVIILFLTAYLLYEAEFLTTHTAKLLAVLALILCPPSTETWINLLNTEFFFGIIGAVILLSDSSRLATQRHLALGLAVLSGPLTTFLAPLYVLRALAGRKRTQITQAAIVCAGGLLQIAIALGTSAQGRKMQPHPLYDGAIIFNKEIVELFLTRIAAKGNYIFLDHFLHFSNLALLACWVLLILAVALLAWLMRGHRPALYLLAVAFWFAFIEFSLSTNGGLRFVDTAFQERYGYVPNLLIELALIVIAMSVLRSPQRSIARVLLAFAFFSGSVDYLLLPFRARLDWQQESWRSQVMRWQNDPTQPLRGLPTIWPSIHLPPRAN